MQLRPSLLDTPSETIECPTDLKACLNAHGLYNSVQFVLRLSPEVHRKIEALPKGIIEGYADFDALRAYSTYLHETIHWWQHSGSTLGLLLSLSYPGQAHTNLNHLKELLGKIGPKKSIRRFVEVSGPSQGPETPRGLANVVINNHFDIEFFRILMTSPQLALQPLMEEHKSFGYAPYNLPVRMLFAHFIDFCRDKLERPESFCWPGVWKTGNRVAPEILEMFERRSAPFLDKPTAAAFTRGSWAARTKRSFRKVSKPSIP